MMSSVATPPMQLAAAAAGSRPGRPRILCVDDDRWVLEGLSDVLGRTFAVSTAASPIEGLELLKRQPDAFAVVLSDMRMPVMPGSEFLRMARLTAPDAVRVLLTGDADIPAAARAVNDGQLFRFLIKPTPKSSCGRVPLRWGSIICRPASGCSSRRRCAAASMRSQRCSR
jgi:CheY-like chemotaxis protein